MHFCFLAAAVGITANVLVAAPSDSRREYARKILAAPETSLTDSSYRTTLLAHEVLHRTGDSAVESLISSDSAFSDFLRKFLAEPEWMLAYLTSGRPIIDTPEGLAVLFELWKNEGSSADFGKYHALTAAIANQFSVGAHAGNFRSRRNLDHNSIRPLDRFRLFRKFDREGRLHPMFRSLKSWELGYVVGQPWSDRSLAFLNENVNLPLERYPDACWAPEYKGVSDFGDTVQGPLFLRPWSDRMSEAQNTLRHGSVCGGLSHYGAIAAAAHGIPAYTVGQPGHCAFAVRFARGDWRGGFGGPDGSVHTGVWLGNIHYIDLAEKVFGDDAAVETATLRLSAAHAAYSEGRIGEGDAVLDAAVKTSPMNLDLRREQIATMRKRNLPPEIWRAYADALLQAFGDQSHPAIDLCATFEDVLFPGNDEETRAALYAEIHRAASRATDSWAWEIDQSLLAPQAAKLSGDAAREFLFREALSAHLPGKGTAYGKVLAWGVKNFVETGKGEIFSRAFTAAIAASGAKADLGKLKVGYEAAILAAEAARSTPAFQALSEAGKPYAPAPPSAVALDLPAGKIVSSTGLIRASSSSWDQPLTHAHVLGEMGGMISTAAEGNPWVIVELPTNTPISGVLIVKNDNNQGRLKHVKLSTSTDGATWFPLAESADMPLQWKITTPVAARWVKFEAINSTAEFLHIRNFIITSGQ